MPPYGLIIFIMLYAEKDPKIVLKAIPKFLEWIALGKSMKSFAYKDEDGICSWMTVVRYMQNEEFLKEHGISCVPEQREYSKSLGYQIWENIAEESAKGNNEKANTASLQMVMRNKFGWDKRKEDISEEDPVEDTTKPMIQMFDSVARARQAVTPNSSVDKEDTTCP